MACAISAPLFPLSGCLSARTQTEKASRVHAWNGGGRSELDKQEVLGLCVALGPIWPTMGRQSQSFTLQLLLHINTNGTEDITSPCPHRWAYSVTESSVESNRTLEPYVVEHHDLRGIEQRLWKKKPVDEQEDQNLWRMWLWRNPQDITTQHILPRCTPFAQRHEDLQAWRASS